MESENNCFLRVNLQLTVLVFLMSLFLSIADEVRAETNSCMCTQKDKEYAKFWNNYYEPEDAYEFGIKVQKLVRERDLEKLFLLVDGELVNGPRQKYIKNKKFSDIFSENWRLMVLENKSSCSPVGWRGFMLGRGLVWYNIFDNKWRIFSINGWIEEKLDLANLPTAWKIGEKILPPQCFIRRWLSNDNFEEYEEKFSIKNVRDFRVNTGKYLGKEISSLEPIIPSWSKNGETISLVVFVEQCLSTQIEVETNNRIVKSKICESKFGCTKYEYEILANVSKENCTKLAPNIPGKCISSYLLKIGDYSGGSMGWDFQYNIYGVFELNSKKMIIAPIKNFDIENDARNYIDIINKK